MEKYLKYFYEMSSIPHGSGNTGMISDYLVSFAKKRGLYYRKDDVGNVVIIKPASENYVNHEPIALQGHIDMVAVKEAGSLKDMKSEGLDLYIDEDYLKAAETSLGGDDGIAVAYMLDILDSDYEHPEIQCIFTVDEEIGMVGAIAFDAVDITSKKLINLDNEVEGEFIAGCAGGTTLDIEYVPNKGIYTGNIYEISVSGLVGGHSGVEIHKNRGNAIKLVSNELCKLREKLGFQLIDINGGTADNVIPSACVARVMLTEERNNALFERELLGLNGSDFYFGSMEEPEIGYIEVKKTGCDSMIALDDESTRQILEMLSKIPCGVIEMSEVDEKMVKSSNNAGKVTSGDDSICVTCMTRSFSNSEKDRIVFELCKHAKEYGASYEITSNYSGWDFVADSPLRDSMVEVYEKMFLCKPTVTTVHAGLEGGIFSEKIPGLDCVSIGPTIKDIHSTKEALSLSSANRCFEFLKEVLKK